MGSVDRIISWLAGLGRNGATANAERAVFEREQAAAAVDALGVRLATTDSSRAA
jgi:hypothetical protein